MKIKKKTFCRGGGGSDESGEGGGVRGVRSGVGVGGG